MSHTNGTDRMRRRQWRAVAENLCTLAKLRRENRNYVVAHALYDRALEIARRVDTPQDEENGSALVDRIQKDQQEVFEMPRLSDIGALGTSQEKPRKAGN